jgi:hypothetical protein
MTEDELQHMKQTLHDVCGVLLRLQIDMQAKADLRDEFAMAALHMLSLEIHPKGAAEKAYAIADAMMEARK